MIDIAPWPATQAQAPTGPGPDRRGLPLRREGWVRSASDARDAVQQRDGCLPQTQPRPQSRPGLESTQRGRVRTIRRGSPVYRPGDQGGWANMRAPRTNAVITHGEDMVGDLIWERPSMLSMAVWSALRRGQTDNRCRRTSPDRGRRKLALRAASCASLLEYRGTLQAPWGRRCAARRLGCSLASIWQVPHSICTTHIRHNGPICSRVCLRVTFSAP
jgi:hypothetical protein